MSGDTCATKKLNGAYVQENGIICSSSGTIIGRLNDDVGFDNPDLDKDTNVPDMNQLMELRNNIEVLDKRIISIVGVRLALAADFAKLKQAHNLKIHDPERENILHRLYENWSKELDVEPKLIRSIFESILSASKARQADLIAGSPRG
jgi:chorismate mutase